MASFFFTPARCDTVAIVRHDTALAILEAFCGGHSEA